MAFAIEAIRSLRTAVGQIEARSKSVVKSPFQPLNLKTDQLMPPGLFPVYEEEPPVPEEFILSSNLPVKPEMHSDIQTLQVKADKITQEKWLSADQFFEAEANEKRSAPVFALSDDNNGDHNITDYDSSMPLKTIAGFLHIRWPNLKVKEKEHEDMGIRNNNIKKLFNEFFTLEDAQQDTLLTVAKIRESLNQPEALENFIGMLTLEDAYQLVIHADDYSRVHKEIWVDLDPGDDLTQEAWNTEKSDRFFSNVREILSRFRSGNHIIPNIREFVLWGSLDENKFNYELNLSKLTAVNLSLYLLHIYPYESFAEMDRINSFGESLQSHAELIFDSAKLQTSS